MLEVLTWEVKQDKEIKDTLIQKKREQSLFVDNIVVYVKSPKEMTKFQHINSAKCRIQDKHTKPTVFIHSASEYVDTVIKNTI